jgi:fructose-1,6-bisphosphatase I
MEDTVPYRRTTFSKFVIEDLRRQGSAHDPELASLLNDLQRAGKLIGAAVARGALDAPGALVTTTVQVAGTPAEPLDQVANKILIGASEWGGQLAGIVSAVLAEPYAIPKAYPHGPYLMVFSPLDGAACLDVGMPVGTFFSILRAPDGVTDATADDFLQPGRKQVAAGYALFGPVAMMVVTTGDGVHGFTLDREAGAYTLTHPNMRIEAQTRDFAIDTANEPHWEDPVRRYVAECTQGTEGPRGVSYTMRWPDSLVAAVHRILMRGGVCLIPRDTREHGKPGHVHLLYEANPVAMLIEHAGGAATTGRVPVLDVVPKDIHERTPLIFGCKQDVELVERYHAMYDKGESLVFESPLFRQRSIFRTA